MAETMVPQELVWGVVREAAAPTPDHQTLVGNFFAALRDHLRKTGFGRVWMSPIDVVLDPKKHLVLQPDLIVIAESRIDIVRDRVWGAPDLVIEILSPYPRIGALAERVAWFARYGVRECWLVNQPTRDVEVLQCDAGVVVRRECIHPEESIRSSVLAEFRESPDSIFNS
jgi:Uma2 family endonuclease